MFIDHYRHRFSVVKMASRLGVSVSSYYDYRQCKHLKRASKKLVVSQAIRTHFDQCHQLYGSRRLTVELNRNGVRVSHTTVAKNKLVRSNSRKGDCWDNAVAESFFKTLKCELIYPFKQLLPAEAMRTELFNYIESWYNRRRRHSALGNLTITEFYNKMINRNLITAA